MEIWGIARCMSVWDLYVIYIGGWPFLPESLPTVNSCFPLPPPPPKKKIPLANWQTIIAFPIWKKGIYLPELEALKSVFVCCCFLVGSTVPHLSSPPHTSLARCGCKPLVEIMNQIRRVSSCTSRDPQTFVFSRQNHGLLSRRHTLT